MNAHIERLAREAGVTQSAEYPTFNAFDYQIEAFARLIAEDCAKIGDELANNPKLEQYAFYQAQKAGSLYVAKAIRERYK